MQKWIASAVVCLFAVAGASACGSGKGFLSNIKGNASTGSTYTVSGTIASNNVGIGGVTVTLSSSATATTDVNGNYTFSGLASGTYKITPTKSGYIFTPTNKLAAVNGGNVSGQNFTGNNEAHVFEKLAGRGLWANLVRTIAVDSLDQVYVTNGERIYRVNGNGAATYVTADDIATAIGGAAFSWLLDISSIDVGPDDKIYILERYYKKILVCDAVGSVAVHRDLSGSSGDTRLIGVIDADDILLINYSDGLWRVKASGSTQLYDYSIILGGTICAAEAIAARHDGYFGYLPGCNQSPVVGGSSDGTGAGILLTTSFDVGIYNYSFSGIGRSSTGGYILNINGERIGRVTTTGQFELIHTQPELGVFAQQMQTAFSYNGAIAEGPTGNIYVLSSDAIYVAR